MKLIRSFGVIAVVATMSFASIAHAAPTNETGFIAPYSGTAKFLKYAPTQVVAPAAINAPLGQKRADRIAKGLGFKKSKAFSARQYQLYMAGQGIGGGTPAAALASEVTVACVDYLTNSKANVMTRTINGVATPIVLGSYGLIVDNDGNLESPANTTSPCRQINVVLEPVALCKSSPPPNPTGLPCGYMGTWMRANGAKDTLAELYSSAYVGEAAFGAKSQGLSGVAQLVTNTKNNGGSATVGMSMVPSIWIANFLLIYALNPKLAAEMPAAWAPIPSEVANAISTSTTGQVSYAEFQSYFS